MEADGDGGDGGDSGQGPSSSDSSRQIKIDTLMMKGNVRGKRVRDSEQEFIHLLCMPGEVRESRFGYILFGILSPTLPQTKRTNCVGELVIPFNLYASISHPGTV